VDTAGSVYATAGGSVLKLAAGATTQTVLPFAGLSEPSGVAVDNAGNVYVTDCGHNRVLCCKSAQSVCGAVPVLRAAESCRRQERDRCTPQGARIDPVRV
jgi:serine/threonine protein kinase, bacterial